MAMVQAATTQLNAEGKIRQLEIRLTSTDEQARILPHLRRQSYHLQKESTQHHVQNHLVVSYRACLHSSSLTAKFEHKSARCRYRLCSLVMVQSRRWQSATHSSSRGSSASFSIPPHPRPLCRAPRTLHRARRNITFTIS